MKYELIKQKDKPKYSIDLVSIYVGEHTSNFRLSFVEELFIWLLPPSQRELLMDPMVLDLSLYLQVTKKIL